MGGVAAPSRLRCEAFPGGPPACLASRILPRARAREKRPRPVQSPPSNFEESLDFEDLEPFKADRTLSRGPLGFAHDGGMGALCVGSWRWCMAVLCSSAAHVRCSPTVLSAYKLARWCSKAETFGGAAWQCCWLAVVLPGDAGTEVRQLRASGGAAPPPGCATTGQRHQAAPQAAPPDYTMSTCCRQHHHYVLSSSTTGQHQTAHCQAAHCQATRQRHPKQAAQPHTQSYDAAAPWHHKAATPPGKTTSSK